MYRVTHLGSTVQRDGLYKALALQQSAQAVACYNTLTLCAQRQPAANQLFASVIPTSCRVIRIAMASSLCSDESQWLCTSSGQHIPLAADHSPADGR